MENGQDTDLKALASVGSFLVRAAISGCKAYGMERRPGERQVSFH